MIVRHIKTLILLLSTPFAMSLCGAAFSPASAEIVSNRHHLSCTHQSQPVVIPHTTASTVQLGLPADVGGSAQVTHVYGDEQRVRIRATQQGIVGNVRQGGALVELADPASGC